MIQGSKVRLPSGMVGTVVGLGHMLKPKNQHSVYLVELEKPIMANGITIGIVPCERSSLTSL